MLQKNRFQASIINHERLQSAKIARLLAQDGAAFWDSACLLKHMIYIIAVELILRSDLIPVKLLTGLDSLLDITLSRCVNPLKSFTGLQTKRSLTKAYQSLRVLLKCLMLLHQELFVLLWHLLGFFEVLWLQSHVEGPICLR